MNSSTTQVSTPPLLHVGIIPDGNRRWCKLQKKSFRYLLTHWMNVMIQGNLQLYTKDSFMNLSTIGALSFYVSSIDNTTRQDGTESLGYELIRMIHKANLFTWLRNTQQINCEIHVVGNRTIIPTDIQHIISQIQEESKQHQNSGMRTIPIYMAMAYDYKKDLENYGRNHLPDYTRTQPMIDLVIRSGNEQRLSGFFPIHTIYSEFSFLSKLWPDITLNDINNCIQEYKTRHRRFGK